MKNITILGAGRSATTLIQYALKTAKEKGWSVTVADVDLKLAQRKAGDHPNGQAVLLDATRPKKRLELLRHANVVISALPAHLHMKVAEDCIKLGCHLVTASYLTPEFKKLDTAAREKGLTFMGEMGMDPGIDHMSAMQRINEIRAKGGKLTSFRSYAGGLVAPECDTNPWHYKFTWNPRNVVMAGKGTAQYLEDGKVKYRPYQRLFRRYWKLNIDGLGEFEAYANRDSLSYQEQYGLEDIPNLLRGSIRGRGYCDAWDALIQIGLTDDTHGLSHKKNWTYSDWLESYSFRKAPVSLKERMALGLKVDLDSAVMHKLEWLGLFSDEPIPKIKNPTPALMLENLLLQKWALEPDDKDMAVMLHEFEYELGGETHRLTSTLIRKGNDQEDTAMAQLVGLPLGIFTKLLLEGKVSCPGTHIPVMEEVYEPVLAELETYGVEFVDKEEVLSLV